MVERVLCMHEAQGSIPCSSIFFFFFGVIRDRYPAPPFLSFFWGGFFWGVFFLRVSGCGCEVAMFYAFISFFLLFVFALIGSVPAPKDSKKNGGVRLREVRVV